MNFDPFQTFSIRQSLKQFLVYEFRSFFKPFQSGKVAKELRAFKALPCTRLVLWLSRHRSKLYGFPYKKYLAKRPIHLSLSSWFLLCSITCYKYR
jgi:hypothetical protein